MFLRVWCGIGMGLVGLFLPFWFFAFLACLYAILWTPYELLVVAVLIDVQFGSTTFPHGYVYTSMTSILLIVSVYIKPLFRFYT